MSATKLTNLLTLIKNLFNRIMKHSIYEHTSYGSVQLQRHNPRKLTPTPSPEKRVSLGPLSLLGKDSTGVFSLERLCQEKVRGTQKILDDSKLPSFKVKALLRIAPRIKHGHYGESKMSRISRDKLQYDLKAFWSRYLDAEELTSQLQDCNKNMGLILNRSARKSPQPKSGLAPNQLQKEVLELKESREGANSKGKRRTERTTFFMNNFIKTRESSDHSRKVSKQGQGEENWVVPWEQYSEEQALMPQ